MAIEYPTRCRIIDASDIEVVPGFKGRNPPESIPHIGKTGIAEELLPRYGILPTVRITLDDGTILRGDECWWIPTDKTDKEILKEDEHDQK